MELVITLVAVYYGLKFVAHLMQQGSAAAAGDELDRSLASAAGKAKSCLFKGCVWYIALCVFSLVAGVVLSLIHSLLTGLWP